MSVLALSPMHSRAFFRVAVVEMSAVTEFAAKYSRASFTI